MKTPKPFEAKVPGRAKKDGLKDAAMGKAPKIPANPFAKGAPKGVNPFAKVKK